MLSGRWSPELETRNIGKSQGYNGLSIHDTTVHCSVGGENTPCMLTCWHPTPAELEALNAGAPVIVRILGHQHPPIALMVGEAPQPPDPAQVRRETIVRLMGNPCAQKLEPAEPFFILLGRDEHAALAVDHWADLRDNQRGPTAKTDDARQIASQMRAFREARERGPK